MITPPFLKPGDTIGVAATARKVSALEIEAAASAMKASGFRVVLGSNIYKEDRQFSGTDAERAEGLNELIRNPKVRAIWMARGGYGSVRVLDQVDWRALKHDPKWVCGFSDVTALHSHIHAQLNMCTLHSEMMLGYEENTEQAHQTMVNLIGGHAPAYSFDAHPLNRNGNATGPIVGGNLSVLYSLLGSDAQLNTDGKILFIEDLDEYLYHMDRMMMALKRAGMLSNLKALVVGAMSDMNDNAIPFGKTAEEIVADVVAQYNYPVGFGFPAGHIKDNRAIALGAEATLDIGKNATFNHTF